MDLDVIVSQAHEIIDTDVKNKYGSDTYITGHTDQDIKKHVTEHMLHANVRLALTLRHLMQLNQQLQQHMHSTDEETGHTILDANSMKHYLATTNQIIGIYKLGDCNKLLFSSSNSQPK
jgi:hypothetical protein